MTSIVAVNRKNLEAKNLEVLLLCDGVCAQQHDDLNGDPVAGMLWLSRAISSVG